MSSSPEILVVDDSATQATLLASVLGRHGYTVRIAGNGAEAIESMRKAMPSLVISDVIMPEMDGYEMCRAIKEDKALRDIPVVLVTSLSDSEDILHGLEARCDTFLTKPYRDEYLLAKIESLLKSAPRRKGPVEEFSVTFAGRNHLLRTDRQQLVDLLFSTYENAVQQNRELARTQLELKERNEQLRGWADKLQQSESNLGALLESNADAIVVADQEGIIRFANAAAESLFNRPREQLVGAAFEFPLNTKKVREYKIAGKGGRVLIVDVRAEETLWEGRSAYLASLRDITRQKRAEEKLRTSEALYHSLVENLPQGIFRKDLEGRFTFANKKISAAYNSTTEDLRGKTDYDFSPPEFAEKYRADDRSVVESGQPVDTVEKFRTADGEIRYVQTIKIPIYDAGGRCAGIQGVFWDITDQRLAQDGLAAERNLLRVVIDHLPGHIYFKDLQGRYVLDNAAHRDFLGVKSVEEVVGKTVYDFFPREMAERYDVDDQGILNSGETLVNREEPVVDSNGVSRWVSTSKVPLRDPEGNISGLVCVSRDVTERKEAEERLRSQLDFTNAITNNLGEGLYTLDCHGRVTFMNPAAEKMLGWMQDELLGRDIHAAIHFQRADGTYVPHSECPLLSKALSGQTVTTEDDIFTRKDGSMFPVVYISSPILTKGEITGAVLAFSDITERKQREDQLKKANAKLSKAQNALLGAMADLQKSHEELKNAQMQLIQAEKMDSIGRLAAGVAHEVKNPLAIMLTGIQYLSQNLAASEDESIPLVLGEIESAIKRADNIIRGLLDFSAPSMLDLKPHNVNETVKEALTFVRHELGSKRLQLERDLPDGLPTVPMDKNKIIQVLLNLLLNAIHATPEQGIITVRTSLIQLGEVSRDAGMRVSQRLRAGDPAVLIVVEDTGPGIPEEKLSKIYDPFFTTKPTGVGQGLGLTVTRKIVELHGGTLEITNRQEGGARASVTFKATQ